METSTHTHLIALEDTSVPLSEWKGAEGSQSLVTDTGPEPLYSYYCNVTTVFNSHSFLVAVVLPLSKLPKKDTRVDAKKLHMAYTVKK